MSASGDEGVDWGWAGADTSPPYFRVVSGGAIIHLKEPDRLAI